MTIEERLCKLETLAEYAKYGTDTASYEAYQSRVSPASPIPIRLLARAIHYLGAGELAGNNRGPFVTRCFGPWENMGGENWCAAFVSLCIYEALGKPTTMWDTDAWIVRARDFLTRDTDITLTSNIVALDNLPAPGDLAVWYRGSKAWGLGHVGIVSRVGDGGFWAIEGNVGEYPAPVQERRHPYDEETHLGFVRLREGGE